MKKNSIPNQNLCQSKVISREMVFNVTLNSRYVLSKISVIGKTVTLEDWPKSAQNDRDSSYFESLGPSTV